MFIVVSCGSTKTPEIAEMVKSVGYDAQIIEMSEATAEAVKGAQGIIISGAPILPTEVDPTPYLKQFEFVQTTALPVLGICFGHQIIGMLHGAKISRCKEDRDWQDIEILQDHFLFEGLERTTSFNEDHCEQITLPDGFSHLASSKIAFNEAMAHPTKPIFGVQFHPEVSGEAGRVLLRNFCEFAAK